MNVLNPLDAALSDLGKPASGLIFPPEGWEIVQEWGLGYALRHRNGLRVIVDCGLKDDDKFWLHVSFLRALRLHRSAAQGPVREHSSVLLACLVLGGRKRRAGFARVQWRIYGSENNLMLAPNSYAVCQWVEAVRERDQYRIDAAMRQLVFLDDMQRLSEYQAQIRSEHGDC